MTGRLVSAAVLVVLVLLAGCGAPLEWNVTAEQGGEQGTETVTPAPVPTQTRTAEPPPGVSGDRVSWATLRRADERVRENASYRVERTLTVQAPDGSLTYDWTLRVAPDGRQTGDVRARGTAPFGPVFERTSFWANATVLVARSTENGSEPVITEFPATGRPPYRPGDGLLTRAVSAADLTVVSRGRQTVLRSADPFRLPARSLSVATVPSDDVTVRVTVSPDGLLRTARVRYRAAYAGTPVQVTLRERTTAVGETTVARPRWLRSE